MRNSFLIVLLLLISTALTLAFNKNKEEQTQFHEQGYVTVIDAFEKSIAFSRYAKPGKISVFIMAAHWCGPCKMLKASFEEAFKNNLFRPEDVDVYYCQLTRDNNDSSEKLEKNPAYRNFKYVDQLTAVYPTTYILAPTTNCYAIVKGNKPEEIMSYVIDLVNVKKSYFDIKALDYHTYDEHSSLNSRDEIQELKREISELRKIVENRQKDNEQPRPIARKINNLQCDLFKDMLRISFYLNQDININFMEMPKVKINNSQFIVFSDSELNQDFSKQLSEYCKGYITFQTKPKELTVITNSIRLDSQVPNPILDANERKIIYEFRIL